MYQCVFSLRHLQPWIADLCCLKLMIMGAVCGMLTYAHWGINYYQSMIALFSQQNVYQSVIPYVNYMSHERSGIRTDIWQWNKFPSTQWIMY